MDADKAGAEPAAPQPRRPAAATIRDLLAAMRSAVAGPTDLTSLLAEFSALDIRQAFHELNRTVRHAPDPDDRLRAAFVALHILDERGPVAAPDRALEHFGELFGGDCLESKRGAVGLLTQLLHPGPELLELVRPLLRSEDPLLRLGAACVLAADPQALDIDALHLLGQALAGDDEAQRQVGAFGLARFRGRDLELFRWLQEGLAGSGDEGRLLCLCATAGRLDGLAPRVKPLLAQFLERTDLTDLVRLAAARALEGLMANATDAGELTARLEQAAAAEDHPTCALLIAELGRQAPLPDGAIAAVGRLLQHPSPAARTLAALAVGEWGPRAEPLLPLLLDRLGKETQAEAVQGAVAALGRIGAAAVPPLVALLRGRDLRVTPLATRALALIGWEAADEVCGALLADPDPWVREQAASLLTLLGPRAAKAVPTLRRLLRASAPGERLPLLQALDGIGAEASPAIPELARLAAQEDDDEARDWAGHTLVKIGPEGLAALRRAARRAPPAARERLAATLDRHGHLLALAPPAAPPDAEALLVFILYAEMEEREGSASSRKLARYLAKAQQRRQHLELGGTTANYILQKLEQLQSFLSLRRGKPVILLAGAETQAKKLTPRGKQFVAEARRLLDASRQAATPGS